MDACVGTTLPDGLTDLPSCTGLGTLCDAGPGPGSGTCVNDRCWLNCESEVDCTSPYQCIDLYEYDICALPVPCGSRCASAKGVICQSPAACIIGAEDVFGTCLLACDDSSCPFDAGDYELSCMIEISTMWFCGFSCETASCPPEHDCVSLVCEPQQP
jgi:hypothetical protein